MATGRKDFLYLRVTLTRYVNKGHIARAAVEATAFQTREVVDAMLNDSSIDLDALRTDNGMIENELIMQFQADILNKPVVIPVMKETTALGAVCAAALDPQHRRSSAREHVHAMETCGYQEFRLGR